MDQTPTPADQPADQPVVQPAGPPVSFNDPPTVDLPRGLTPAMVDALNVANHQRQQELAADGFVISASSLIMLRLNLLTHWVLGGRHNPDRIAFEYTLASLLANDMEAASAGLQQARDRREAEERKAALLQGVSVRVPGPNGRPA